MAALAVKSSLETPARNPVQHLAVSSLLGGLYLLLSVGFILTGLPIVWSFLGIQNAFLSEALLLIVTLAAIVGLVYLGRVLEGAHPPHGLRAGAVFAAIGLFLALVIGLGFANLFENAQLDAAIGWGLGGLIGVGLVVGLVALYLQPFWAGVLQRVEDQGWFHLTAYKPNQGVRVRRGTILGLLVLIGCGIYTLVMHRTLGNTDWAIPLPYTDDYYLFLVFHANYVVPVLLIAVLGWLTWRVVNWPAFADFLIATEAEMNKVSWTTRRRLVQDTIVVLVTVFLLTAFLFFVDIFWIKILSNPFVHVLQVDLREERLKQNQATEW